MAARAQPLGAGVRLGGGLALALVAALTLGALAALGLRAEPGRGLGPAEWAARALHADPGDASPPCSRSLLAVPAARALARRRFPGRALLVTLLGAPFLLPVIVAVFGLVAVWGRGGLFSAALAPLGLGPLDIYGLRGVVLAHVFFNLPLVTRLLLAGLARHPRRAVPPRRAARLRAARHLPAHRGADAARACCPARFVLVFLLCMT